MSVLFVAAIMADNYFASNRNKKFKIEKLDKIIADNYFASNRNRLYCFEIK